MNNSSQHAPSGSSGMSGNWQSDRDTPHRREMIQHIVKLLKKDRNSSPESMNRRAQTAKHLEVSLYRNARSFAAYMDRSTLKQRLQQIAVEVSRRSRNPNDTSRGSSSGGGTDDRSRRGTDRSMQQQQPPNGMRGESTSPYMGSNHNSSRGGGRRCGMSDDEEMPRDDASTMEKAEPLASTIDTLNNEIVQRQQCMNALKRNHKKRVLEASLTFNAEFLYAKRYGFQQKRNNKENILLALNSNVLPKDMEPELFDTKFPPRVTSDRDILLARLELPAFAEFHANQAFVIPKKLRNDKEVACAVCSKSPESLQFVSYDLQDDTDVVLSAVQSSADRAPLAIRHASQRLQKNKTVVRVTLNRGFGVLAIKYIAPALQKDKKLILRSIACSSDECNREFEILSELPDSLRGARKIVEAAVKKRGSNLQYARERFRKKMEICLPAVKQDGNAFQYVLPGEARNWLLERKYFRIILEAGGGKMFEHAPLNLQNDKGLLLLAVQNGLDSIGGFETLWRSDKKFSLRLLCENGNLCSSVPVHLLNDNYEIVIACLKSERLDNDSVSHIFQNNESVRRRTKKKISLMVELVHRGFIRALIESVDWVPNCKRLIMAACSMAGENYSCANAQLKSDPDVIMAALTSSNPGEVVFAVPPETLDDPKVVLAVVERYGGKQHDLLSNYLPQGSFRNRSVLMAWIQKGWRYLDNLVTQTLVLEARYHEDHDVMAAIIGYESGDVRKFDYSWHPSIVKLFRNRDFLKKAIRVDSRLLYYGSFLRRSAALDMYDYELLLLAIASDASVLQNYHSGSFDFDVKKMCKFAVQIRDRLNQTDKAFLTFLCGISIAPRVAPALRSPLPLLDRGHDIKRIIAEYTGIPMGEELRSLRKANTALEFWGY